MRHSCVTLRGTRFVPLRPEFVAVCDENAVAALLLAWFDFRTASRRNDAEQAEAHGEETPDRWIKASYPFLARQFGGAFGDRALRTAIELLLDKGFLVRQNDPERKLDRALTYRLQVVDVNRALTESYHSEDPILANDGVEGDTAGIDTAERNDHAGTRSGREEEHLEPPTPTGDVEEVWAYYVSVFNATRMKLDTKRRRAIKRGLKVRSVAECKRAIDGLRVSEHHNGGPNGTGQKYLDIRYALTARGGGSDDTWIDSMIELAERHAPVLNGKLPSDHHKIQRWLREVRYTVSTQGEKARGRAAFDKLVEHGFKPKRLDAAPWVVLET